MAAPTREPIGLQLTRTSKAVSRAFDEALAVFGGSLPTWLILVSVKTQQHGTQREIAKAVGIEGPTLTHHLNRLEREGLITRTREPDNRRVHRVELTEAGNAAFLRMLTGVQAFDRRLRTGMRQRELTALEGLLARLRQNVETVKEGTS
ncbi:MAG: slyA [Frankiales bacterium]|jgi:MarR family transcriptional regulator for hemolysin|nr:slyA [Frankiales bacterium]